MGVSAAQIKNNENSPLMHTSSLFNRFLALCPLLVIASSSRAAETPNGRDIEFFETKVRPVLVEKCFSCHGAEKQRGGLRLDSREAMLKGGDSGAAFVAGEPQKSILIRALHYDGALKMPPAGKLNEDIITALTQWIQNGAAWPATAVAANTPTATPTFEITPEQRKFWSFQPVKAPALPKVKNAKWAQSPLDNFILAELEKRGLQPAPTGR